MRSHKPAPHRFDINSVTPRDWTSFWTLVARQVRLRVETPFPEQDLTSGIGVDPLQMCLLLELLADLDAPVPDELVPHLVTADDVYHHYVTRGRHVVF